MKSPIAVAALTFLCISACTDDDPAEPGSDTTVTDSDAGEFGGFDVDNRPTVPPADCDPLDERECALPWPSNLYLLEQPERRTTYTLSFGPTSLPANFRGVHIAPDDYQRLDGYGLSTPILTYLPNVDLSEIADDSTVERSLDEDAPIRLYRVVGGALERVPYFAELDAWEDVPEDRTLYVRPAVILEEASRYVVAFTNALRDVDGQPFERSAAFQSLIDGRGYDDPALADRVLRFEEMFDLLGSEGVERDDLLLAWDFVTASSEALHGRMLEMREEGFEAVGRDGPELVITEWVDQTPEEDPYWAALVRGYVEVPRYMREDVASDPSGDVVGWTFNEQTDGGGLVEQNGTRQAEFWVGVPHSVSDGSPHTLVQHGHGLFGLGEDATGSWTAHGELANTGRWIIFGSNWTGMSEYDFGNMQFAVFDLNRFHWLTDRSHQGVLEFLLLARAMKRRFAALPEVEERGIEVDPETMYYEGISQGGIYGGTYMALTQDIERGHLGVPGQNYTLLTHRSENFDQFFTALAGAYPGRSRQAVLLAALGSLWDMIDPATYYRHISQDPFDEDPPRRVLLTPSFGDHSVTELSVEIAARTLGADLPVLHPIADDVDEIPLTTSRRYPVRGSGVVFYSWPGQRRVPGVNKPAPRGEANVHTDQRWLTAQQRQMLEFFGTGEIVDTCGGNGCTPE